MAPIVLNGLFAIKDASGYITTWFPVLYFALTTINAGLTSYDLIVISHTQHSLQGVYEGMCVHTLLISLLPFLVFAYLSAVALLIVFNDFQPGSSLGLLCGVATAIFLLALALSVAGAAVNFALERRFYSNA